jgi:hypothetical protein
MTKMVKDSADWIPPPSPSKRPKKKKRKEYKRLVCSVRHHNEFRKEEKKERSETQNEDGPFRPDLWESPEQKKEKKKT